jgi:hypothetical protein
MPAHIQGGWRWCSKCQGLALAAPTLGPCPAGGTHSTSGSSNYAVVRGFSGGGRQTGWRWCNKCQGLWLPTTLSAGRCPAGGGHSSSGSGSYSLVKDNPAVPGQTGWRWCSKCQGLWQSGNATPGACPAGGGHTQGSSGNYTMAQLPQNVRLHVKVLTAPTSFSIDQMLDAMRQVYNPVGIGVDCASVETLNLPALNDCDVGQCIKGSVTAEQTQLFSNRNNVGTNELVVYFVRSTVPAYNGCAAHPTGRPGAIVVSTASQWTLAHEIGHVLGLSHCDTTTNRLFDRLMTGGGTSNITNPPADVIQAEVGTMKNSALTLNV